MHREAVRPDLTHPDAMTIARAIDHEQGLRLRDPRAGEGGAEGQESCGASQAHHPQGRP